MLIVDRIAGAFAVCEQEDRVMREIPLSQLPEGLREGDCLREDGQGFVIDAEETARRRAQSRALLNRLLEREDP